MWTNKCLFHPTILVLVSAVGAVQAGVMRHQFQSHSTKGLFSELRSVVRNSEATSRRSVSSSGGIKTTHQLEVALYPKNDNDHILYRVVDISTQTTVTDGDSTAVIDLVDGVYYLQILSVNENQITTPIVFPCTLFVDWGMIYSYEDGVAMDMLLFEIQSTGQVSSWVHNLTSHNIHYRPPLASGPEPGESDREHDNNDGANDGTPEEYHPQQHYGSRQHEEQERDGDNKNNNKTLSLAMTLVVLLLMLFGIGVIVWFYRRQRQQRETFAEKQHMDDEEAHNDNNRNGSYCCNPSSWGGYNGDEGNEHKANRAPQGDNGTPPAPDDPSNSSVSSLDDSLFDLAANLSSVAQNNHSNNEDNIVRAPSVHQKESEPVAIISLDEVEKNKKEEPQKEQPPQEQPRDRHSQP